MDEVVNLFSVIIPTYNRRDVLLESLEALASARRPWPCELVVVVDGSADGTREALTSLRFPFPLRLVYQENGGAAAARNRGAADSRGKYLLFLDDDMSVDKEILVEHEKLLSIGADAVVGQIPLHPDSPKTILARGVDRWAEQRNRRLCRSGGRLGLADLLTGQLSVRSNRFTQIGGFDSSLTANGGFGGEDTDFLYRLLQSGAAVRFCPTAISHQRYIVTAGDNLRQWRAAGRADALLSRKHPGIGAELYRQHDGGSIGVRAAGAAARLAPGVSRAVSLAIQHRVERGRTDLATEWAFAVVREQWYWAGVRSNGGISRSPDSGLRILAYHAVEDSPMSQALTPYCVSPPNFERQLEALLGAGFTFVTADEVIAHLDGRPLPPHSVLLTFDDAYQSVADQAAPITARLGIPAVVCVVTSQLGGANVWDSGFPGARPRLLGADRLHELTRLGWEVASHTRTHAHLTTLRPAALADELVRSRYELEDAGLPSPRLLAYPYGEHDWRVRTLARRAGYDAALAIGGPQPFPTASARFALPRIEVDRDTPAARLPELVRHPAPVRERRAWLTRGLGTLAREAGLGQRWHGDHRGARGPLARKGARGTEKEIAR